MATASVSFDSLLSELNGAIGNLDDPRKPSNASNYTIQDTVLGAFGCFFMQSASFLDYQRQLDSRNGRNNAQSLFGLKTIPSVAQIRNILDQIAAQGLFQVFVNIYRVLDVNHMGFFRAFDTGGEILLNSSKSGVIVGS